ncbi:MAG TPA: hypothetical protein VNL17_05060 [Verrucomicrobiae bacterium]|nr:hypothetical protein [Verrucomicrobiae bacterium]
MRKILILIGIVTGAMLAGNCRAAVTLPETRGGVGVQVTTNGDYEIRVHEPSWVFAGNVGYPIQEIKTLSGQDAIGAYHEVTFRWNAQFSAGIRRYDDKPAVLFSVNAPAGANVTNVAFPSFTRLPANLHGFSYREENFAPPSFKLEQNGTPWLLFDDAVNTAVISPATNFLVARLSGDGRKGIASGLNPEVGTLDKPLTHRSLLVFGRGVGATFQAWGEMLTDLYGKKRPTYDADPTLKSFGYWTDNGADYYYRYDKDLGYRGTLLKMLESYRRQFITLGYFQLDSWWYQKSTREPDGKQGKEKKVAELPAGRWNRYGGTMDYTADPDLFPLGLAAFHKEINLPLVVHGRWVDRESPYQKQYKFSGVAPIDPAYWEDRMTYLATNGVCCYEQDWLDRIYFNSDLGRAVGLGDAFADGMAAASADHGLTMQYCMALPRHFLQGAKYSNLTTIRTSGDRFEPGKWRPFLYTSQLAAALGMWPWCDVFKSGEKGNMIVAVLSAGVVGTGDAMGKEAPENIRLAARADGVLVKPDRPVVPTDDTYLREARGVGGLLSAWTCTDHGDHRTLYGFAFVPDKKKMSDAGTGWTITPAAFGIRSPAYVYDVIRKRGVTLATGKAYDADLEGSQYAFVIIAPIGPSGIAFLGDPDKIASTGKQRIADIRESAESLKVTVLTAAGESAVTLHGFAEAAPVCQLADGKELPVQYDATTKNFTVAVNVPAAGGEHVVMFRRAGAQMEKE